MKRSDCWAMLAALLFACLLWVATGTCARAEEPRVHMAPGNGGIWCAEGSTLKWIEAGGVLKEAVYEAPSPIEGVAAGGGAVYLLLSDEQGARIHRLSPRTGELTAQFAIEPGAVRAMAVTQAGIAVLYEPTMERLDRLCFEGAFVYYDFAGNTLSCPVSQALTLIPTGDGGLFWVGEGPDGYCLNRLDEGGTRAAAAPNAVMLAGVPLPQGGYCYVENNHLCFMDEAGNSTQLADASASEFDPPAMALSGNWVYLIDESGLHAFDGASMGNAREGAEAGRLTLVNCMGLDDYRMEAAIAQFEAQTGVRVLMTEVNRQQLLTQLMSKEEGIDVLFVDSMSLNTYQQAGVLQPLGGYAALNDALDSWMDVFAPVSVDGELYCVPAYIHAMQIGVEPALLPYWGRALPESCTWSEFFAGAKDFQMDTDGDGVQDACYFMENLYYPEFTRQYVSAHAGEAIDFSDPAFTALLSQYKQLVKEGYVKNRSGEGDERVPLFASGSMVGPHVDAFLPTPTLEDGTSYEVGTVHSMAISAFSKQKDLAAEFLALYAAEENQVDLEGFGFLEDLDLNPKAAQLTESERAQLEKSKRQFESVAPLWQNDAFTDVLWEGMRAYIADEIEIEELVKRLNQRMRMVIYG